MHSVLVIWRTSLNTLSSNQFADKAIRSLGSENLIKTACSAVKELTTMQVKNKQDFWSGVMFILVGVGFAFKATSYSMGTAARMGPGYFPFWLGILMACLGAFILLTSLRKKATKTAVDPFDFRILAIIVGGIVLFAFTLRPLGLILSLFLLVMISSMASHEHSWKVSAANAVFLTLLCWLSFVKGLGLVFPIWPTFLGLN